MERSYLSTDEASVDHRIKEYIRERCHSGSAKKPRLDLQTEEHTRSEYHINDSSEVLLPTKVLKNSLTTSDKHQADGCVQDSCNVSCDGLELGKSKAIENSSFENSAETCDTSEKNQDNSVWLATFEPRSSVEKPKNAICIEQSVKDLIAITVMKRILQTTDVVTCSNGQPWNKGGMLKRKIFENHILMKYLFT